MKKFLVSLFSLLFLLGCVAGIAACNPSAPVPEEKHNVNFYDGETLVSTFRTGGNEVIPLPEPTAPDHFRPDGWFLDAGTWEQPFTEKDYSQKKLTEDLDVYAKWTQTEFQVTFEENGGSDVADGWFGKIDTEPATDRQGYIFGGWFASSDLSGARITFPYALSDSVVLYAKWTEQPRLLAIDGFSIDGTTASANISYTAQTDIIDISDCVTVSEGASWEVYADESCQNQLDESALPLNFGTNRFYLKVNAAGQSAVYTLIAEKSDGYDLTVYENGKPSASVHANKGDSFARPLPSIYTEAENFRFDGEYFADEDMTIPFTDFTADANKTVYLKVWYVGFEYSSFIFTIQGAKKSSLDIVYAKVPSNIDGTPLYYMSSSVQNDTNFKKNLREVVVEEGIRTIENSAFYNCDYLEKVTLPDGIMLAGGVFSNCPKLSQVICDGAIRSFSTNFSNTALYNNEENRENGALYIGNYLADFNENKITSPSFKVKDGTVSVSGYAFSYKEDAPVKVTSVDFGNTVKYIGAYAFSNAQSITSFVGMDAVESIGKNAFLNTGFYKNTGNWTGKLLYLNNWLIASDAFTGALSLRDGTVGIADSVFLGNTAVTSVDFGNALRYIGKSSFSMEYSSASALTSVVFPASLCSIDEEAFYQQTKLTSVKFNEGLLFIGDSAFQGCNAAGDIVIPASVKVIQRDALSVSANGRLFLANALQNIRADKEWNGWGSIKTPYYEYSDSEKDGRRHYADGTPVLW